MKFEDLTPDIESAIIARFPSMTKWHRGDDKRGPGQPLGGPEISENLHFACQIAGRPHTQKEKHARSNVSNSQI